MLQQKHSDKAVYIFSGTAEGKRKQHSSAALKGNLLVLIEEAHSLQDPVMQCTDPSIPILVGNELNTVSQKTKSSWCTMEQLFHKYMGSQSGIM